MTDYTTPPKDADGELETELIDVAAQLLKLPVGTNRPLMFDMDVLIEFIKSHTANAVLEAKDEAYEDARTHLYTASQISQALFKVLRLKTGRMMIDAILDDLGEELAALKQGPTNAK